jgi:hypothetical protein
VSIVSPRGRPRAPAPVHLVAMRELTAAMRQIRIAATGDNIKNSVALLNASIEWLYPDAHRVPDTKRTATRPFSSSVPRMVTERYLANLELGHHSRVRQPAWLRRSGMQSDNRAHASRVPAWLVRAYDVSFGADGYLVDVYRWARQMQEDSENDLPRSTRHLPERIMEGDELSYLSRGFADAPVELHQTLAAHAEALRRLRGCAPDITSWRPSKDDGSGNFGDGEDEVPEGTLVRPGEFLQVRWVLDNTGKVPWTNRMLFRVNGFEDGIHSPPFVPLSDTGPGQRVESVWPMRAPAMPGTYRLCIKMGWPDGVYCFPNTLLGLSITLIVPPADMIDPHQPWCR